MWWCLTFLETYLLFNIYHLTKGLMRFGINFWIFLRPQYFLFPKMCISKNAGTISGRPPHPPSPSISLPLLNKLMCVTTQKGNRCTLETLTTLPPTLILWKDSFSGNYNKKKKSRSSWDHETQPWAPMHELGVGFFSSSFSWRAIYRHIASIKPLNSSDLNASNCTEDRKLE